jgi:transposase
VARARLAALGAQLRMLKVQFLELDRMINAWHRSNEASKRLDAIPGVGPALATALVASVADPKALRSGRNFSAWIELVPKQNSSGGKDKLGSMSKQGDRYLRSLFTASALAVIRYAKVHDTGPDKILTPVTLPTGRARLATRPNLIGSPPTMKTMGIVEVAAFAASGEGTLPTARNSAPVADPGKVRIGGERCTDPSRARQLRVWCMGRPRWVRERSSSSR